MSEQQQAVLSGIFVDESLQRLFLITAYVPPPGAGKFPCTLCGQEVWLGPKQQQYKTGHPEVPIYCIACLRHSGFRFSPVQHLGGQGGTIKLADGKLFMPNTPKN